MADNTNRPLPNYDIEAAVSEGSFEEMQSYVENTICFFQQLASRNSTETLKTELQKVYRRCDWLIHKFTSERNTIYLLGYLAGQLDARKEQLSSIYQEQGTDLSASIPHWDEILYTIEGEEGIRHSKLADAIGIDKSTLTGIMDRVVASGAVVFSRPGKFKFYYLTETGKRYCNRNRQHHQAIISMSSMIDALIEQINRSPNSAQIVGKVMQAIYKNKPISSTPRHFSPDDLTPTELVTILDANKPYIKVGLGSIKNSYNVSRIMACNKEPCMLYLEVQETSKRSYTSLMNAQEVI